MINLLITVIGLLPHIKKKFFDDDKISPKCKLSIYLYFIIIITIIYNIIIIDIVLERGKAEREGQKYQCERNIHQSLLVRAMTGDGTLNPGTCPDQKWNRGPFALQDGTQPTEPHWSGLSYIFINVIKCHLQRNKYSKYTELM